MGYKKYPYHNRDYNTNEPSYYDDLAKKVQMIKMMVDRIEQYDEILKKNLEEYRKDVNELIQWAEGEIEKIRSGGYLEQLYLDSLKNWIDTNLEKIVPRIAKLVWFGLTDDGYFMAVIPESWEEICFDTTVEGNLVLQY